MIDRRDAGILTGITMVIVIAGIFAFLVPPAESEDKLIVINGGGSNGTATSCDNIGNGGEVYKNTTNNTCYFRTIVGSPDISVTQQFSTLVIDFNGTSGESTQCFNVGSGVVFVKNSTSGNCYIKTAVNGNGITISNGTNTVTFTNSGVLKDIAGTGISVNQTTGNVLITNTLPEASSASNVGNGANIFKNETGDTFYFKTVLVGNGLTISNGTNIITLTNSLPEATTASNVGSGAQVFKNETSDTLYFKTIKGTSPIEITNNTNDVTITCTTCVTTSSFPLQWTLLNSTSPTDGATTWTINIASKKFLYVDLYFRGDATVVTAGGWGLRFNGDTGGNYNFYKDLRGTVNQGTGQTSCDLFNSDENWYYYQHWNGYNVASQEKVMSTRSDSSNGAAVSGSGYSTVDCGWTNTSNAITSLTIFRQGGTVAMDSTTTIWVYGHD